MVLIEKTSGRVEAGSTVATEDALAAPDLISRLHASRQAAVADVPASTVADVASYLPEQKSLALEALEKIYDTAAEKMEVALRTCFHRFDTGAKGDIDIADFGKLLAVLGEASSPELVEQELNGIALNEEGRISYASFVVWWAKI